MPLDKDLQSIQEMRDLVQKAKQAQLEFRAYDQKRVGTATVLVERRTAATANSFPAPCPVQA